LAAVSELGGMGHGGDEGRSGERADAFLLPEPLA
jgi:hypothetical protein